MSKKRLGNAFYDSSNTPYVDTNSNLEDSATVQAALDSAGAQLSAIDAELAEIETETNELKALSSNAISSGVGNPNAGYLGLKNLNIIGDSISHGANAPRIYDDAWTGIFRELYQMESGNNNYGFASLYPALSNAVGTFQDIFTITGDWVGAVDNNVPGFYKRTAVATEQLIASLNAKPQKILNIGIGVVKKPDGGDIKFSVLDSNDVVKVTSTQSANAASESHAILWLYTGGVNSTDFHKVKIENVSGSNTIFGIYIMENQNLPVMNNYSKSGAKIEDLTDDMITNYFNADTVIFALGHNSNASLIDAYLAKCVTAWNIKKPMVYVLDFTWTDSRLAIADKLKEFAKNVNGVFIDYVKRVANANTLVTSGFLTDVSHPSVLGHKIIAERTARMVGLSLHAKDLVDKFSWEVPTYANGWSQYLSTLPVGFKKIGNKVKLKGSIGGGTANTAAFFLRNDCRPSQDRIYAVATAGGSMPLRVAINGGVTPVSYNQYVSLDGVEIDLY